MKNSKKILSLALTLAMLLSAVFCTGAVANAEITTSTTSQVTVLTPPNSIDVSSLGPNLIPDSTVAEWDGDTYKTYYSQIGSSVNASVVGNANAWWDQPACFNQRYLWGGGKTWGSLKENNRLTKDVTHTADGSGAIVLKSQSSYLPIQTNATPKYFLYTFWAKAAVDNTTIMFCCNNSGGAAVGTQVSTRIHSDWTLVTLLLTAGKDKIHAMNVYVGSASATAPVYIDDVYMFRLDDTYGETLIQKGKFLSPDDITYATSDTAAANAVTTADGFDFASLGENLAPDPTVNMFDNGVYSDDGIYSKVLFSNDAAMWKSPKYHGAPVLDTANSHTADGSGVLKYDMTGKGNEGRVIRLTSGAFDAYSYYLVTAWVKSSAPAVFKHNILYLHETGNLGYTTANTWTQIKYIVYTGNYNYANGLQLFLRADTITYVDDIAVYRLDAKYGSKCKSAGKLYTKSEYESVLRVEDTTISADNARLKIPSTYTASTPIVTETLGTNLCTDSTVAAWNGDSYDTSAWWTKVPFNHSDAVYGSMYTRGFLTNDTTKSHTKDGSGAIVKPSSADTLYLPLTLPNLKSYYLVTAWIKSDGNTILTGPYTIGSELLGSKFSEAFSGWRQIAWIIYQGGTKISNPSMCVYATQEIVIDELCIYELDYEFGKKCIEANTWATGASSKENVAFNANSTQTITATDGYFIPYGAVQTADGKIAEKLGNGQFYATTAGNYSCAEFKYPTGTVGTFGASAKTTGTTGIQFGSLITDNLSVDKNAAQGTLVFRGDFNAFRATFPTNTRKELAAEIYAKLKAAEEAKGINLANRAVTLNNGGKSVVVMYVPRTTYMWKNSENTELQYAVRVTNITENAYKNVDFTAIGYVTKGGNLEFSNEIKTAKYTELLPTQN